MNNLLPNECFDLHPGKRLDKTREFLGGLSEEERRRLENILREQLTFSHRSYAYPAWGMMVVPGPGGKSDDPTEPYCDWTPGLGEPSRHFAEYPTYITGGPAKYTWQRMRSVIRKVVLPGVEPGDRFACWGWANLTTEHARREVYRNTKETEWVKGMETLWQVIEACRPPLIIAPPGQDGSHCYARVQQLLRDHGSAQNQGVTRHQADRSGTTCDFYWWDTPWGACRLGRMHNQPYIWGKMVAELLTKEAHHIASRSSKSV